MESVLILRIKNVTIKLKSEDKLLPGVGDKKIPKAVGSISKIAGFWKVVDFAFRVLPGIIE